MSGSSRWNPLAALAHSWGHFVRRPRRTQLRTVVLIVAVGAGVVVWLATSPSSTPSGSAATASPTTTHAAGGPVPVSEASTSTRGIQGNTINVAFPVVSLNSLAGQEGFAEDPEFGEQTKAIQFYVKQINDSGGINGRHINPIITSFDPTSETAMRALCKTWTEGSPPVFAVIDGLGDWTGDNQLCVTQEGQTPFIGAWSTVTNYTNQGSPYLWWTGPDQAVILQAVVDWGLSAHLIGGSKVLGVIAGDRASDQLALNDYLLPDLRRAGVSPVVETIASDPTESATTNAQAPLVIQQLRSAGVTSVIPLIPFNVFYPVLQAEISQQYFPRLLLSDYEESIESALGLIPIPFEKALDGQEGLTTQTLGGSTTPSNYTGPKGYDPGVKACWTPWHKAYPQIPSGDTTDYLEEQGPVVGWCQAITLFAQAARNAGSDLNRRTFVTALSKVTDFPGTSTPILSYGPDKRYGPTLYKIVRLHNNVPPSSQCQLTSQGKAQGTCWTNVTSFQPLPTASG
jgi:Periplasmic binding protein